MNDSSQLRTAAAQQSMDELVPALAQQYQLDGLHLVEVLPVTGRNVNVVLADAQAVRYVARCYLRNPGRDRIGFQLDFQDHLHSAGVPVPAVLPAASGELVGSIEGTNWVVFEHMAGTSYDPGNQRELHSAARWLNTFHDAGRTFAGKTVADDSIPDLRLWWVRGEDEIGELQNMFAGRDVEDELEFLTEWHHQLTGEFGVEFVDQLPTAWLHSDYHGNNLAFDDGEVVGIFDFDVVHHGWRLDDIARAVYYFARQDRRSDLIRPGPASAFVNSFGLTEGERAALPAFLVAVHARTAARYRVREREGSDPATALRQHVDRMRRIQVQDFRSWCG